MFSKKMAKIRSGWKTQVKNDTNITRVDKENISFKKVFQNLVKKERKCQNTENIQFLSFNKFSVLENEELLEELDDCGTCEKI